MPELPEVETTKDGISPHLIDHRIREIKIHNHSLRWPIDKNIKRRLKDRTVKGTSRRGKYLLLHFENGTLIMHLGMSGSLRVVDQSTERQKHDHFEMIMEDGQSLRLRDPRRFGAVLWTSDPWQNHKLLAKLGPEPLTNDFTDDHLYTLSRNKRVNIKSFIMDGHVVVGVGNIYASESLFLAGIHPTRPANRISKTRYIKLTHAIKKILEDAISQGGTTLKDFSDPEGNPGYFVQSLNVYGRASEPCPVCQRAIKHKVIAQRATYYCSHCQR